MAESSRPSATSLQVKSNSLRPTQSIAGDAFNVSVGKTIVCAPTKPIFVSGFCDLIASATLQSSFCDGEAFFQINTVRRAVEQFGIRRERGGLREPRRIPIAGDFAPRLITRTG